MQFSFFIKTHKLGHWVTYQKLNIFKVLSHQCYVFQAPPLFLQGFLQTQNASVGQKSIIEETLNTTRRKRNDSHTRTKTTKKVISESPPPFPESSAVIVVRLNDRISLMPVKTGRPVHMSSDPRDLQQSLSSCTPEKTGRRYISKNKAKTPEPQISATSKCSALT